MIDVDLLSRICETPGAPGFEHRIRTLIKSEVEPLVDDLWTDKMGNLVAKRKGRSDQSVLVTAHMDEISFIVTHIDEDGYVRFHTLGGFDPKTLTAQRVIIHGVEDIYGVMGSKAVHVMDEEERKKPPKTKDYFIDTGRSVTEVKRLVRVGDPITRERQLIELGDCVNAKSLDNRISVFMLIETLRKLKEEEIPYDFFAGFTVQEEVGIRGAKQLAHKIDPDFGIAMDTTVASDTPNINDHEHITKLGKGVAIKIMDGLTICDVRMVKYLKNLARDNDLEWQAEVLPAGGTDTAGIQRSGKHGSIAGAISIPTRYLHQVIETVHKKDVANAIELLRIAIVNMDKHDWSHRE